MALLVEEIIAATNAILCCGFECEENVIYIKTSEKH